ncbi:hypothetical protein E1B28_001644 [Marasmius oreades]|uniref:Uncharacterized protein n=1 Tax=Marasmius oreades TaxID=181124 RepID=A0A9P8AFD8_9AGAR|nr:uncharacterized protein E1B28_001644 [Marasmius oreades]KAG7099836.1 hypothetical protein E1B28_001644 [Marasmius oreades]
MLTSVFFIKLSELFRRCILPLSFVRLSALASSSAPETAQTIMLPWFETFLPFLDTPATVRMPHVVSFVSTIDIGIWRISNPSTLCVLLLATRSNELPLAATSEQCAMEARVACSPIYELSPK